MRENKTKLKLQQGGPVFGVISSSGDPMLAEIMGLVGFDYYMLDAEHGLIDPEQAAHVVRACESVDVTPLIRIGPRDPKLVLQYLDAGMMGVMMPGLATAVDVQMLVDAVKYPPLGKRGLGLGRAANYMLGSGANQADYVTQANAETMVIPQFEEATLLAELPTMMAVLGVDICVIGPRDLSLTMGFPDGPNHAEVQVVIDQAISIMLEAGVVAGITAATAVAARQQIARGARFILNSIPSLLKQSSQAFLSSIDK